jgi:hypothetical protein
MARISWQLAIRAGSWDCSHRKNELIAASRWLRVEMLLCRGLQPVQEGGDGVWVNAVESESLGRDGPLVAEPGDEQLERVAVGRDRGRRAAAQPGQVRGEEAVQHDREVSCHRAARR